MKTKKGLFIFCLAGLLVLVVGIVIETGSRPDNLKKSNVISILSADQTSKSFKHATDVVAFDLNIDSGPHNDFQTEWWYFTGNLTDAEDNHYGYQLTFFRRAISSTENKGASLWRTNQIYMGHFAILDVRNMLYQSFEKLSRDSIGLAGADIKPFKVWLENWRVKKSGQDYLLEAQENGINLSLKLKPIKPAVFHGDNGLSRKSDQKGNASYYYSFPRLASDGILAVRGSSVPISGLSWMDHEWSTSVLNENQVGWDWFSIQLNDGKDLMLFQIREVGGKVSPYSSGTLINKDGTTQKLHSGDFSIAVLGTWESPHTKIIYPSGWHISIPGHKLNLELKPYFPDQEHRGNFTYWEGAVKVKAKKTAGNGYVELTGYRPKSSIF